MPITVQRETYDSVIGEIKPLLERHWQEVARNKELIPLDPRYEAYRHADISGSLRIYTVRAEGILIGYAVYFIHTHFHYQQNLWALSDIYWVDPYFRRSRNIPLWALYVPVIRWFFRGRNRPRVGEMLFKFAEKCLTNDGVTVMHTTSKCANPAAKYVLEKLGHSLIEFGHAKVLKKV